MAISPDIENGPFVGNGTQAAFAFTFTAITPAEVTVTLDGVAQSSGFTVSLNESGGTVTFATPPAAGAQIVLRSSPDYLQDSVFENEGAYNLTTVNTINRRQAVRALVTKKRLDAASVAAADASAGAAAASAAAAAGAESAAAGFASAAAGSASAAGTSASGAANSAAAAAGSVNGAALASATAGAYPNSAATNVPRGLTQASVGAITAGSGGTNGTFALAWSGGNFTANPSGTFTVSGGALTAVTITGPGLHIGASPTVPTPSFAASSGLAGAGVALSAQFLVASGQGYWVQSADGSELDRYSNVGGVATAASGVGPVPLNGGAALAAANSMIDGFGRKNLIADPRFLETTIANGYSNTLDSYFTFAVGWVIEAPSGTNPYVDSQQLRKPAANFSLTITALMDNLGLIPGDVFRLGIEMHQSGTAAVNMIGQWRQRDGSYIGGNVSILSAAHPGTAGTGYTPAVDLTVPAKGARLDITFQTTDDLILHSLWAHRGVVPARPVDTRHVPAALERIEELESKQVDKNNIALKRVDLTKSGTRTVTVDTTLSSLALSATTGGYGAICNPALSPDPFNAVQLPLGLQWFTTTGYNPPSRIYAMVRTAGAGENPATDGALIAEGYINVDPTSGAVGAEHILLYSPATKQPVTVTQAMLGTLYFIAYYGVTADKGVSLGIYNSQGVMAARDSTYNSGNAYQFAATNPRTNGWSVGGQPCALRQVMLTTPKEVYVASPNFAAQAAAYGDEVPAIIALPPKVYAIVGKMQSIYYDNIMQRPLRTTNIWATPSFSVPANGSGPQQERFVLTPTAAGSYGVTIAAHRGDTFSSSAATSIIACVTSATAGTRKCHFIGDSLIANGGTLTQLLAISAADGVTNITLMGTQGTAPKLFDAESGQSLGQFFTPTYKSGATNPFYNTTTHLFDYAYYLSVTGQTAPDYFFIEGGQADVGPAGTDSAAGISATNYAANVEAIIASVHAASPTTKVVVYTATAGPRDGQDGQLGQSYGPAWRSRRNWMILAQKQISQFSGREASGIYVSACGVSIDPEAGWPLTAAGPKNSSIVAAVTYATYAGMLLNQGDGTLAYVTDVAAWFVKVGGSGLGYWRSARPQDGIVRRYTDTIHYANGAAQVAAQHFALIKNIG
ncbi:MAG: hypothetical protein WC804_14900 [Sphingomonas sp.]|uniref:hypothetical protein n=1 Tax=Sphingomonas sp. TaxID=28214 RepID=UPI0035657463